MPTEEHDSWLGGLGVDIDKARNWVGQQVDAVKDDVQKGVDWVKTEANTVVDDVKKGADWVVTQANTAVDEVKKGTDAVKMKALGDQSGKPVPRPMETDCKPEHGYVPGPKNHLLCATHGHVIDTAAGTIIAESVASYVKQGAAAVVSNLASTAAADTSGDQPADPNAANAGDNEELAQKVVAELNKQLDAKVANEQTANQGIFDELNHLEDNRETNTIPSAPSFDDFEPRELQRKIKEEQAAIPQLEQQRLDRAKAARADARAATEKLKKDATFALFAGGVSASAATVTGIVARIVVAGSGGASLALLASLTAACIAELKIWSDYRDTLRTLVDKAKADIKVINTNIEFSKEKIEAMQKALKEAQAKQPQQEPIDLGDIDDPKPAKQQQQQQPVDLGDVDEPKPVDLGDIDKP